MILQLFFVNRTTVVDRHQLDGKPEDRWGDFNNYQAILMMF
jgi:hypothetical protein